MSNLATIEQKLPAETKKRERAEVIDHVPLLDTARFEHMQRVATVMARSTLMPETLWMEGKKDSKQPLPYEQILSNCFMVVNQAVRWGLDPFAVAQCVSVVHGKLCYEGKLVSAVLQAKMGINLHHHLTGDGDAMRVYLSDKPFTDDVLPHLKPGYRRTDMRIFDGSVGEWKTTGAGTPWTPKNFPRMLIYRGSRDWCRIYEPALMLGVYTPDEMESLEGNSRFNRARDVTPANFDPLSDEPIAPQSMSPAREVDLTEDTAALSGEAETEQEPSGEVPPSDAGSGVADPSTGPAADQTVREDEAGAGDIEAQDRPDASPASDLNEPEWLLGFARAMVGAIAVDEAFVVATSKGGFVEGLTDDTRDRARAITNYARSVCRGEIDKADALEVIAGKARCEIAALEQKGGA